MIAEDHNVIGVGPEQIERPVSDAQEETENDSLRSILELIQIITHDTSIRTVKNGSRFNGDRHVLIPNPGNRFVHYVPPPLRHFGCMWLADGDETQRCGKPVAWTMGANLSLARLYCEDHGHTILHRRRLNYDRAHQQKRRNGNAELAPDHKSPPQHHTILRGTNTRSLWPARRSQRVCGQPVVASPSA